MKKRGAKHTFISSLGSSFLIFTTVGVAAVVEEVFMALEFVDDGADAGGGVEFRALAFNDEAFKDIFIHLQTNKHTKTCTRQKENKIKF